MSRRLVSLTVLCAVLATGSAARAEIAPPPPPHEIAERAQVMFVGTVASVGEQTMRVAVGEVLKGAPGDEVTVLPVHMPTCTPGRENDPPWFRKGDRILVAATLEKEGYLLVGGALATPKLRSDAEVAHTVAFEREILRIVALPGPDARRAAFVRHMASEDASLADAARSFMYAELSSPEKSRAHVEGLVAALGAPHASGRYAAMYALRGHAPQRALARLLELTCSTERDEAESACAVLGWYDDARAVDAIVAAAQREGNLGILQHLGPSPRAEAVERMRRMLGQGTVRERKVAFVAFQHRLLAGRGTERDEDALLDAVRAGVDPDERYDAAYPLRWSKGLRVAKALVALIREDGSSASQRITAGYALWWMAGEGRRDDVAALLREEEALFARRLDAGTNVSEFAHILGVIGTDSAKAALTRATTNAQCDEFVRTVARSALDSGR